MPDYRKRKHGGLFSAPARVKKSRIAQKKTEENIEMTPSNEKKAKNRPTQMKVVKGRKIENKRKLKVGAVAVSAILVVVIFLQLILPAGIIEGIKLTVAVMGRGSYPIELESTETINTISRGSYYFVLSNNNVYAFNNSGKRLFSYTHGYEKPVLKVSASRSMVFEQGGNEALIFDINGLKSTVQTEKTIVTGAVSDSGAYALVTVSDKYASAVSVYSKKDKIIYEWFSAEDTVNNVALNKNGKKLAVSTFNSNAGQYKSKIYVLNFKSATPEYTETLENSLIYTIDTAFANNFCVVSENGVKFIKWRKYEGTEYKNEYKTAFFRSSKNRYVVVFNRASDKTDNRIAVFSKKGKLTAEFQYKGTVSDIAVLGEYIYCMSDTEITMLNKKGEVLRKGSYGFGAIRLNVSSTDTVIVITDNKIEKFNLEQ